MSAIIDFNGMPGVGKLTIAKILAERINGRLIDNHLIIDLVMACVDREDGHYKPMLLEVSDLVLKHLVTSPLSGAFIFTNALVNEIETDLKRYDAFEKLATDRDVPFIPILITCDFDVNRARLVSEDRKRKKKLTDQLIFDELTPQYTLYHPEHPNALTIDNTGLSPDEVVDQVLAHTNAKRVEL